MKEKRFYTREQDKCDHEQYTIKCSHCGLILGSEVTHPGLTRVVVVISKGKVKRKEV